MSSQDAMVIVGAGHVGGRAAHALREKGWEGPIVMVGAETHLPYERPPLSKGLLTGEQDAACCALRQRADYDTYRITHVVARVESIDTAQREVVLVEGAGPARRLRYASLLVATGGHARRLDLPGAGDPAVLGLRTLDDAAALGPRLEPGTHLLVVGGGFIGLEVAASARRRGCRVTLFEGAPRLLGRAVPPAIAAKVQALHEGQGVEIRLGTLPTAFRRDGEGRLAVEASDGSECRVDTVVVGIGIDPAAELGRRAGLAVQRGIVVDRELATSAPNVYAAGDVAEFPSPLSGALIRQETWQNAETQARVAAANMLGGHEPYQQSPWFWSDQYDHQLQVCGEPALGERIVGRALGGEAVIDFHLDGNGRVVGVSGFGPVSAVAKELKLARLLVERGKRPAPEALADPGTKLKSLL